MLIVDPSREFADPAPQACHRGPRNLGVRAGGLRATSSAGALAAHGCCVSWTTLGAI
jgi:hypothetical protein